LQTNDSDERNLAAQSCNALEGLLQGDKFSDQEAATCFIDNHCDLMKEAAFPNTAEKIIFSVLLITVRRDIMMDKGLTIVLDCCLYQIQCGYIQAR
jgi:hypothetical protein